MEAVLAVANPASLPSEPRPVDRWNPPSLADTFLVRGEGSYIKYDILNCLCNNISIMWEMQWIMGVEQYLPGATGEKCG